MAPSETEYELDDVDRRIVTELSRDGRMSMRALAEATHISRAHAYVRVDRLVDEGVIEGFTARIAYEKAGFGASAPTKIMLDPGCSGHLVPGNHNIQVGARSCAGERVANGRAARAAPLHTTPGRAVRAGGVSGQVDALTSADQNERRSQVGPPARGRRRRNIRRRGSPVSFRE
jgi:DNA-binding Lrp family transcriptional regulator